MKKTLVLACAAMLAAASSFAQNFEGVVKYSRVNDPSKMFASNPNRPANPQFGNFAEQAKRPVFFELTVKGDQALYKTDPNQEAGENSIEINGERRTFARRLPKDETLYDLKAGTFKKYEEYAQQPFQISGKTDEIRWKVDPTQTRQVLGYECMMATASESEAKKMPVFQDGGLTVKDSVVTTQITAWFTDAVTTSAGPEKYSGLPGLILALDINDGVTTYVATNVEPKTIAEADFKINSKGKKVTPEQFKKLKDEHQAEQAKNFRGGPGGGITIMRGN